MPTKMSDRLPSPTPYLPSPNRGRQGSFLLGSCTADSVDKRRHEWLTCDTHSKRDVLKAGNFCERPHGSSSSCHVDGSENRTVRRPQSRMRRRASQRSLCHTRRGLWPIERVFGVEARQTGGNSRLGNRVEQLPYAGGDQTPPLFSVEFPFHQHTLLLSHQ